MARTLIFSHPAGGQHETPPGHPEQAARFDVVEAALRKNKAAQDLEYRRSPSVAREALLRAHSEAHVERIERSAPKAGLVSLDGDTTMGPSSLEAALAAAGGAVAAVDAVASGDVRNAFVIARPPGHHATKDQAMGFCLFNNGCVAAMHARSAHGFGRIAVLDFDVHHGNGTQDILEADENAFFASTHEWPQYPGSGAASERGRAGNCHNVPLPSGTAGPDFLAVWSQNLLPALRRFEPDFIVISAGFDGHRDDPLGGFDLTSRNFGEVTEQIREAAEALCSGRIVSVLEGGYDLPGLADGAAAHVAALANAADA